MANQFTINLIWVPGHRDIVGNCIVDELTRQGTNKPLLPGEENVGMPMATCKLNIKNKEERYSRVPRSQRSSGQTDIARLTRLVILIKNICTLWGRKRFLLPVTYFPTNLVYPFTLRITGITPSTH